MIASLRPLHRFAPLHTTSCAYIASVKYLFDIHFFDYTHLALKDADENRLERITKLLEILSIEMGTIANGKAVAFTDDVKLKMDGLKSQLEILKPIINAKKEALQSKGKEALSGVTGTVSSVIGKASTNLASFFGQNPPVAKGGKRNAASAYKSTGDKVFLFIDNKKLHRSIYVKGKAKYCKINNEFILLSKLKNKIID